MSTGQKRLTFWCWTIAGTIFSATEQSGVPLIATSMLFIAYYFAQKED